MKSFTNQFNLRVENQLKFINLLRHGPQSINYLADQTNISFTAANKIVDQLESFGVLNKRSLKPSEKKRGRTPSQVSINTSVGVTCAIDFSSQDLIITINDLVGNVIVKRVLSDVSFIEEKTLSQVVKEIKQMLSLKEIQKRPLLGICIASPGMISKNTGEIEESFRVKAASTISLSNYFFNEFGVKTNIYNDVKISCLGETIEGCIPKEARNYLYVHLGNGCGTALVVDKKVYQGKNGFSGELSNIKDNPTNNRLYGLRSIALKAEEIDSTISYSGKDLVVNVEKLVEEYKKENPVLLKAIDETAKADAIQLIAYNDLLDLEYIVIEGPVLLFKEYFKESLLKYIKQYDNVEFRAKIIFSSLNENSTLSGAIYQANSIYFLSKLEEITSMRDPTGNYDISDSFGDYI